MAAIPQPDIAASAKPRPWRGLLIGLLVIPPSTLYGVYAYIVVQALLWTQTSLLRGPVFVLFALAMANLVARRLKARFALTGPELLLIYTMVMVSTAVGGIGMVQFLVPILGSAFYYATPENRWAGFHEHIPRWLVPNDPAAINGFFQGYTTLYQVSILRAWLLPVVAWTTFLSLLLLVTLCATVLLRRRWVEEERLTFPLIQLPLEMARDGASASFWGNRLMWAGFALAGILESVNFWNWLSPTVPYLPIKPTNIGQSLVTQPWSAARPLYVAFYPFMIGIGYLLTLNISFSCWAFYLITKLENVLAVVLGFRDPGASLSMARVPYIGEQGAGAFIGLALLLAWSARGTLREAWQAARAGRPAGDEMLSPREAFAGLILGYLALVGFCWAAGLNPILAAAFLLIALLFAMTITRIVAEAGAGWTMGPWMSGRHLIAASTSLASLGPRNLTVWSYFLFPDLDYRDTAMPHQMQGARLGTAAGIAPRHMLLAILLAGTFGIVVAFWAHLHVYYTYGCATAKVRSWITSVGQQPFVLLRSWLSSPPPTDQTGLFAAGAGLGITALLVYLRQHFLWWPLHPVGYALANTSSLDYVWCPFFIAWLLKTAALRFGGIALYRRTLPFFLGLILGDYVVPTVWGLIGVATKTQMYMAFPH